MTTFSQTDSELIKNFNSLNSWDDKYAYLISLGKSLPTFDEEWKTATNIIEGCQSKVWFKILMQENQRVVLYGTSDSIIVKGIIGLILEIFNNKTPQEILATDLMMFKNLGLLEHLSPNRSTGLYHMIKHIRVFAKKLSSSDNTS